MGRCKLCGQIGSLSERGMCEACEARTDDRAPISLAPSKEWMDDRRTPSLPSGITITRIDLSMGNVLVLALKFGAVWFVLGVVGALIVLALS